MNDDNLEFLTQGWLVWSFLLHEYYEELFGTVRDEIDKVSDNMISKIDENQYRIDGKTTIYDFERFFHVELKDSEDSDVVTLSGL